MRWIVDGYNVIHADQKLSKLLRKDGETARRELLREVISFTGRDKSTVTLVFDSRFPFPPERISATIDVRFSGPGETADDLIKKAIGDSPKRRSLRVVSDDLSIVAYARECGAKPVGSREFLSQARTARLVAGGADGTLDEKPEPNGKPDPELLRLFGVRK